MCIIEGRRGARVQRLSVDITEGNAVGGLHWTEGAMPFPTGAAPRDCWTGVI